MADAIYCRNGHFIDFDPEGDPGYEDVPVLQDWEIPYVERKLARMKFCARCGAETLRQCLHCESPIILDDDDPEKPAYCGACGKPFPWTQAALQAANEMIDELEELNAEDKIVLKSTFDDLTVDTPRTELAATRYKRILKKVTSGAGEVLTKIIIDIASEAAVKLLKG